jgi:CBS domain-containing protein
MMVSFNNSGGTALRPAPRGANAMTVAAMLKAKGHEVIHAPPTATVAAVVDILARRHIGALLVLDQAEHVLGIVSERDIIRTLGAHGASALDMPVTDIMTTTLQTATPQTTSAEALAMMTAGRFRHLPVLDRGALVGLISIGDVVKLRLNQQEHEVDSLKAYVAGSV